MHDQEIRQQAADLLANIQAIQEQLGNRNHTDEHGNRLGDRAYWAWRAKAQHALRCKLADYRALKEQLRQAAIAASTHGAFRGMSLPSAPGMHLKPALVLKAALEELVEDIEVCLEEVGGDYYTVTIRTGDFPDITIYQAAVHSAARAES